MLDKFRLIAKNGIENIQAKLHVMTKSSFYWNFTHLQREKTLLFFQFSYNLSEEWNTFLTTTFFDQLLTVERFAVGGATKFLDHFSKNFNEEKKFFAYVLRVRC